MHAPKHYKIPAWVKLFLCVFPGMKGEIAKFLKLKSKAFLCHEDIVFHYDEKLMNEKRWGCTR